MKRSKHHKLARETVAAVAHKVTHDHLWAHEPIERALEQIEREATERAIEVFLEHDYDKAVAILRSGRDDESS